MNIGFLRQAAWACILLILASGHTGCEFKSPEDVDNGIGSMDSGSSVSNAPSKQAIQLPSGLRPDGKMARFDYNFHIKLANVRRQMKCLEALELLHIDSNTVSQGGGGLGESWESFPYGPDAKNGATATFYYVRDAEKARTGDFNYLVNGLSIQYQGVIYSYNYDSARERYLFVD